MDIKNSQNLIISSASDLFKLDYKEIIPVSSHQGGRNIVFIICQNNGNKLVLRVSYLSDRTEKDYLAETEFISYLAKNTPCVTGIIPSINNKLVECILIDNINVYLSVFEYAKGILISDNNYKYIDNTPIQKYFYDTGKTLGKIHQLSKEYIPHHKRSDYFDKYNMTYIEKLIPDNFSDLKKSIASRILEFGKIAQSPDNYGLIHFDFSDGNYHIDMTTGDITVFDFDNCMYCWYMFDIANLWTHGVGWCQFEKDPMKRKAFMEKYMDFIIEGYKSETYISDDMFDKLPIFIDMVLIENIVDEFECCQRENRELDYDDIKEASNALIFNRPFAGFFD